MTQATAQRLGQQGHRRRQHVAEYPGTLAAAQTRSRNGPPASGGRSGSGGRRSRAAPGCRRSRRACRDPAVRSVWSKLSATRCGQPGDQPVGLGRARRSARAASAAAAGRGGQCRPAPRHSRRSRRRPHGRSRRNRTRHCDQAAGQTGRGRRACARSGRPTGWRPRSGRQGSVVADIARTARIGDQGDVLAAADQLAGRAPAPGTCARRCRRRR